ncbi:sensor histidine kinase [Cryobacterium sinapicolor]|uniref:histidine kinase n=1 Tax=Cryobacterium sinapicolor TaxID=1259236 RepID=A0ABY2J1I5_9MICO|nr:sensor domain-containing protein [Cryobacterium sinapicolor]TFC98799.1 sensor histidine kinase [Cryobacterium sinapicolor]
MPTTTGAIITAQTGTDPTAATPTAATPTAAAPTGSDGDGTRTTYGALWRRVPQELLFLLLTLPVVVIALTVLSTVFFTGVGLLAVVVGIVVVVASLYLARGIGLVELVRLRWAGQPATTPPRWETPGEPATTLRALLGPLVNGHYWLYLLHGMVVNVVLGLVSWTVTVVWLSVGLGGVSYWFWGRFLTDTDGVWLHEVILGWVLPGTTLPIDPLLAESLFQLALGLLFLLTLPYITHAFTLLHQFAARGMLGAWRSEALQREVADLSASRGAAVAAEDQSLRRLERDIHDGPQQRLVRLQMDLASAERKLTTDPDAARALIVEAREQAHDTLEELRALSRGLVPPILQDRGLLAGLESLAARSTVPVRLELQVDPALRLSSEIERSAYFVAAELLTNAAKHARATGIRLHLALRPVADEGSTGSTGTAGTTWLDLWVIDDGVGGARLIDAHGLQGLDERLRGLRGVLSVRSPDGGPTAIGAHIPLPAAVPVRAVAVS